MTALAVPDAVMAGLVQEAARRAQAGRVLALPTLHAGQRAVYDSPARFRVLNCGRRWGKSTLALVALVKSALKKKGVYWWVWPTGPMGQTGWEMLHDIAARAGWEVSESRRRVLTPNGSALWVKSADHEDGLRGAGLSGVVLDECRDISARTWPEVLRPALADRQGWALFASTPRGFDWFHELYARAQGGAEGWASWSFTTYDNPRILTAEIDSARAEMTERQFKQEVLAEFVTDGVYFSGVEECATIERPDTPHQHAGHSFVAGLDWGLNEDYTVLTVICRECSRVVDWWRAGGGSYIAMRERVVKSCNLWGVQQIMPERNSMGQPNIELLRSLNLPVALGLDNQYGWFMTASNKAPLIEKLSLALQTRQVRVPREYSAELRAFEAQVRANGHTAFGAPGGMHDDCVISLALAWWTAQLGAQIWI